MVHSLKRRAKERRGEGGLSKPRAPHRHHKHSSYLWGLEVEPRAPLALPAREQTSSPPRSSRSVQNREHAMGRGSEPVCRLGAHPLLHTWGTLREAGHGPLSLLMLPYSQEKSLLRLQLPRAEVWPSTAADWTSSLPTSGSWGVSPTPYLQGRDSAASLLSFYLASALLSVCHHPWKPPSPLSSRASRPLCLVLGPRPAVGALRLSTDGVSLAEPGLSVPTGQRAASTHMLL